MYLLVSLLGGGVGVEAEDLKASLVYLHTDYLG